MAEEPNMTARPVNDNREHHLYVTIQSASEASRELAARVNRRWKEKNVEEKKQLVAEIIDTYLPHNKVTEQERETVRTDDFISLMYGEGDMVRYYDLNICNLHEPIKPVTGTIKISLTHWLALNEIDREAIEIKEREEKMYDNYFRNIVYMKEKECIEEMLPEAMKYLRFEPFIYDTQFLSEMARKEG